MNKFPLVSAKIYLKNGKVLSTSRTNKTKRLYARIRGGNFSKIYFKVEYGKGKTNYDKKIVHADGKVTNPVEMFYNDATCTNKKEALEVLHAFLE